MDAGGGREGNTHLAGGVLLNALIDQPLLEELPHIHEIRRCAAVDHGVSRPCVALAGGAIHRYIQEITLLTPAGIFYQLVDKRIGTAEVACILHIRVDSDRLKVRTIRFDSLNKRVPEAEHGEMRRVLLDLCAFADIGDLLKFLPSAVAVGGREFSFLVQSFAMLQVDDLTALGIAKRHMNISCKVLSEVDDELPRGVTHGLARKALLFPHGNALVFDQFTLNMLGTEDGFLPAVGLNTGVINLALLQIRPHDGTETDLPVFIRGERFCAAIGIKEPQLAPERQCIAEVVVPAPPAVAHGHTQIVIALP